MAHVIAPANWDEPDQRPEFDQVRLLQLGSVTGDHNDAAGERVRYAGGPRGAEYVAICLPTFAPDPVNRED